jgi:hypothetical protein
MRESSEGLRVINKGLRVSVILFFGDRLQVVQAGLEVLAGDAIHVRKNPQQLHYVKVRASHTPSHHGRVALRPQGELFQVLSCEGLYEIYFNRDFLYMPANL